MISTNTMTRSGSTCHHQRRRLSQSHGLHLQCENYRGIATENKDQICATFNQYFQSAFVVEPPGDVQEFPSSTHFKCTFESDLITTDQVEAKLRNLIENKSADVDGVTKRTLKNCATAFARPVALIFKKSINTGVNNYTPNNHNFPRKQFYL